MRRRLRALLLSGVAIMIIAMIFLRFGYEFDVPTLIYSAIAMLVAQAVWDAAE